MLTVYSRCDLSNAIALPSEELSSKSEIIKPEKVLLRDLEKATISCMPSTDFDTNTMSSTNNISIQSNLKICCVCNTEIQRYSLQLCTDIFDHTCKYIFFATEVHLLPLWERYGVLSTLSATHLHADDPYKTLVLWKSKVNCTANIVLNNT